MLSEISYVFVFADRFLQKVFHFVFSQKNFHWSSQLLKFLPLNINCDKMLPSVGTWLVFFSIFQILINSLDNRRVLAYETKVLLQFDSFYRQYSLSLKNQIVLRFLLREPSSPTFIYRTFLHFKKFTAYPFAWKGHTRILYDVATTDFNRMRIS